MVEAIKVYGLLAITAVILVISQLLLKQGIRLGGPLSVTHLSDVSELVLRIAGSPFLLLGYVLSGVSAVTWLLVLSRAELSYAAPIFTAIYYLLLVFISAMVLGETVGLGRGIGTILIVVGVALIMKTG